MSGWTKEERAVMAKAGQRGGKARARNLSPERLREIAAMGAAAREKKRAEAKHPPTQSSNEAAA